MPPLHRTRPSSARVRTNLFPVVWNVRSLSRGGRQLVSVCSALFIVFGLFCAAPAFADTLSGTVYRQLRDTPLGNSYHCENFTLTLDVGTFEFKSGTFTLFNPVYNFETGLIFIGTGHFSLKPFLGIDKQEMVRRSGGPTAEE